MPTRLRLAVDLSAPMTMNRKSNAGLEVLAAEVRNLQRELTDTKTTLDKIWGRIEQLQQPKPTPWGLILSACMLLVTLSTGILAVWGKSEWGPLEVELSTVKRELEKIEQDKRWIYDTTQQRDEAQDRLISTLFHKMLGETAPPFQAKPKSP